MKLSIEHAVLNKALARVTAVVERRNTIQVLANVLISATNGEIWLAATDLDIDSRVLVPGTITEEGAITAEAGLLADIVRNAPSGAEVCIEHSSEDPRLIVRYGKSRFKVPVLPADLFPTPQERLWAASIPVRGRDLKQMLDRVSFAMATDNGLTHLCGVYLHMVMDNGMPVLRVVATDKYRVAIAQTAAETQANFEGVIIPAKTVREIARAVGDRVDEVTLQVSDKAVRLEWDGGVLTSKIYEGAFLDYQRVVPDKWETEIELDAAIMASAVRRVALLSTDKARTVKLDIAPGVITLLVRNGETGEAVEEIQVEYDGPGIELGFNARNLMEAMGQTEAETLAFRFNDNASPARLEPVEADPEHGAAVAILMPLKT